MMNDGAVIKLEDIPDGVPMTYQKVDVGGIVFVLRNSSDYEFVVEDEHWEVLVMVRSVLLYRDRISEYLVADEGTMLKNFVLSSTSAKKVFPDFVFIAKSKLL